MKVPTLALVGLSLLTPTLTHAQDLDLRSFRATNTTEGPPTPSRLAPALSAAPTSQSAQTGSTQEAPVPFSQPFPTDYEELFIQSLAKFNQVQVLVNAQSGEGERCEFLRHMAQLAKLETPRRCKDAQ